MNMLVAFISTSIPLAIPLLYGSTGEIITEKSGHLNLGIPGIMYVGGISSVIGSFLYENACAAAGTALNPLLAILIPLLCCVAGSALMGLIYSFMTVTLRVNQNVTGLALTTFGIGIGNFFGGSLIKLVASDMPSIALTKTSAFFRTALPFADKLGWFGEIFLSHDFLTYTAVILALVASWVLTRTRVGLNLRSVGENPATADAAGINVTKYKYLATCIGSAVAGLGGLQYVMAYANGVWSNNAFGDRGWMAIALVIFALWKPNMALVGSLL
ncbi:MAG: ABC transporter permease, partial [Oscillospiraceae bacterium]|nr:ABC transporter permease [Oscillospiraceae bacterium]